METIIMYRGPDSVLKIHRMNTNIIKFTINKNNIIFKNTHKNRPGDLALTLIVAAVWLWACCYTSLAFIFLV